MTITEDQRGIRWGSMLDPDIYNTKTKVLTIDYDPNSGPERMHICYGVSAGLINSIAKYYTWLGIGP